MFVFVKAAPAPGARQGRGALGEAYSTVIIIIIIIIIINHHHHHHHHINNMNNSNNTILKIIIVIVIVVIVIVVIIIIMIKITIIIIIIIIIVIVIGEALPAADAAEQRRGSLARRGCRGLGWQHLSNAACLIRPRYALLIVSRITIIC